uniref:Uncharacterized protein n=1 Tax=Ectropis obliqua nucleopolyhedrovirus TaxID=59376 RepID=S5TJ32_9ABAC|nr:hypothetical protein wdlz-06GM3 [Ectropis obliqua nucleopolyhedrovirus]QWV59707.1 hypothetical protein EONV_gp119 [Ectropis obliqua nucleopolyhedrovirus]UYO72915.1 hypothetical protein EONV-gp119 [Ectropis obliqua nucleopolyhedrovirus]
MLSFQNIIIQLILILFFAKNCMSNDNVEANLVGSFTAHELNVLIDEKCVPSVFADTQCQAQNYYYDIFESVTFDFTNSVHIELYGVWLRFFNNLEYYKSHDPRRLVDAMARHSVAWTAVNTNISIDMQTKAAEVFRWTADTWTKFHIKTNYAIFEKTLVSYINFFNTLVVWCNTDTQYFLKTVLYAFADVRNSYKLHTKRIDTAALNLMKMTLEYPLTIMSETELKKQFYLLYVYKLAKMQDKLFFDGYYTAIKKNDVMANLNHFVVGPFNVSVHHNVRDAYVIDAMYNETLFVYNNVVNFFARTGAQFKYKDDAIDMFVYDNYKSYESMGQLWSIRTDNGGYTHTDRRTHKIESHVYRVQGEILPRNYGHELQHAFMFLANATRRAPKWFVEGVANRIGNRECHRSDHEAIKHNRNITIATIMKYTYASGTLLYGMGSALTAFLHETQPYILGRMMDTHNFVLNVTHKLEYDFDKFKGNKILECEKLYKSQELLLQNESSSRPIRHLSVEHMYLKTVNMINFKACPRYVMLHFDDVTFIMTPYALIKTYKNRYNVNPTIEIKQNKGRTKVSQYDYNWFLNGILKRTLNYFGDSKNYFKINNMYSYASVAVCDDPASNPADIIIQFGYKSGIWDTSLYLQNKNLSQGKSFVQSYLKRVEMCKTFINPTITDKRVPKELIRLATNVATLRSFKLSHESDKFLALDVRANTILHLLALFNHNIFLNVYNASLFKNVKNNDGDNPYALYLYAIAYQRHFGVTKLNKFCYTKTLDLDTIVTNDENKIPTLLSIETTTAAVNSDLLKSNKMLNIQNKLYINMPSYNDNDDSVSDNHSNIDFKNNFYINIKLYIIILVVVVTILILINTIITLLLLKCNEKKKKKMQQKNLYTYNKNKFYNNDDFLIKLFE